MKISRGFVVVILIMFALLVMIEVKIPKRFDWDERTYCSTDSNPFGAMLVDSLLQSSLPGRYEVKEGFLSDAIDDSAIVDNTVLLVDYSILDYEENEINSLLDILRRGQSVIYIDEYLPDSLSNLLEISIDDGYEYYYSSDLLSNSDSTTFVWQQDSTFSKASYRFRIFSPYNNGLIANFDDEKPVWRPIIKQRLKVGGDIVVAASRNYGKGKLIIMTWTQLFTNYNVLEKGGAQLLMRLLSQATGKKIVRYDYHLTTAEFYEDESGNQHNKSSSPLRVFLDNRSLRWAVYLAVIAIALFMIFTAKRRQRVIPLVEPPKNHTLTMVKHIGLMHYRNHDNAGLVRDYYKQFAQLMLRKLLVNVNDDIDLNENINLISSISGIERDKIIDSFSILNNLIGDHEMKLSDKETMRLIDFMNNISKNL